MSVRQKLKVCAAGAVMMSVALAMLATWAQAQWSGDNRDGTYSNPILFEDYPDPDVIRVGDDYYLVSTSMEFFPGCPIMKSRDLVNWQTIGYAMDRSNAHRFFDMDGGTVYGDGPWATSIRHHNGKFYVLTTFNGNYNGQFNSKGVHTSYMCVASDPAGPWEVTDLKAYLYDPSMLFDDDGRVYVVCGQSKIMLYELNADGKSVKSGPVLLWSGKTNGEGFFEGNRAYKINGWYYFLNVGGKGLMSAHRSKNITGPFECKTILKGWGPQRSWPKQGSIVQTAKGEWWSILFEDGSTMGRVLWLEPLKWVDGWPMYGPEGNGYGVVTWRKPDVGTTQPSEQRDGNDEFDGPDLNRQWQWNHNPDNTRWSLSERPGYLRLKAGKPVADLYDLGRARNTLVQRMTGRGCCGTVEMDLGGLREGDVAGLSAFIHPTFGYVGVQRLNGKNTIIMAERRAKEEAPVTVATVPDYPSETIWLRIESLPGGADAARFYYSADNRIWHRIGTDHAMRYRSWKGYSFALFNFSTGQASGHADFNWFHVYHEAVSGNRHIAFRDIEAGCYDEKTSMRQHLTAVIPGEGASLAVGNNRPESWLKFNNVNFLGGANRFQVRASNVSTRPARLELHLDGLDGPVLGTCAIAPTGDKWKWDWFTCPVGPVMGRHGLFVKFLDAGIALSRFRFDPVGSYDVMIQTEGGCWSVDSSSGQLRADRSSGEIFEMVDAGGGQMAIRSRANGKFVTRNPKDRTLHATADSVGDWEKFQWVDFDPEHLLLVSAVNKEYAGINHDGAVVADRHRVMDAAKIRICPAK